jgi:pyruvate ferredoxin oxidoreductase gamma subunit
MLKEIRLHGRGGQGVVTAAELLAEAAFEDGKYAQAFPSFGSERMGAPVQSFVRISEHKVRARNQIDKPDYLIVQDSTLIGAIDVLSGLKDDGMVLVDTAKKPEELGLKTKAKVLTIPATEIALETLGKAIQNTTLMGAFAGATGLISVDAIKRSVKHRFPGELGEKNAKAVQTAYDLMRGGKNG